MFKRKPSPFPRPSLSSDTAPSQPNSPNPSTPSTSLAPPDMYNSRRTSTGAGSINNRGGGRDSLGDGNRTFVSRLKERTSSLGLFERKAGTGGGDLRMSTRSSVVENGENTTGGDSFGDEEGYLVIDEVEHSPKGVMGASRHVNGRTDQEGSIRPGIVPSEAAETSSPAPSTQQDPTLPLATPSLGRSSSTATLLRRRTIPRPLTMIKFRDEDDRLPNENEDENGNGNLTDATTPSVHSVSSTRPHPLSASSHRSSFENIPQPSGSRMVQPQVRQGLPVSISQRTLRSAGTASFGSGKTNVHANATGAVKVAEGTPTKLIPSGSITTSPAAPITRRPATATSTSSSRLPRPNSIVPLRASTSSTSIPTIGTQVQSQSGSARRTSERVKSPQEILGRRMSTGPGTAAAAALPETANASASTSTRLRLGGGRSSVQMRPRTSDGPSAISTTTTFRQVSGSVPPEQPKPSLRPRRPVSMMMLNDGLGSDLGGLNSRQSSPDLNELSGGRRISGNGVAQVAASGGAGTPVAAAAARRAALERLNGRGGPVSQLPTTQSQTSRLTQSTLSPLRTSPSTLSTPIRATPRGLTNPRLPSANGTPTRSPRSVGLAQSTSMGSKTTPSKSSPLRPSPSTRASPKLSASPSSTTTSSARRPKPVTSATTTVTPSRSMPIPMPVTYGPSPLTQRLQHQPRFGSPAESFSLSPNHDSNNGVGEERDRKSSAASNVSDIDARMAKSLARHSMTFEGMVGLGSGSGSRRDAPAVGGRAESPLTKRVKYPGIGNRKSPSRSMDGSGGTSNMNTTPGSDQQSPTFHASGLGLNSKTSFSGLSAVSIGSEDDLRTTGRAPSRHGHGMIDTSGRRNGSVDAAARSRVPLRSSTTAMDSTDSEKAGRTDLLALFSACSNAQSLAQAYDQIVLACETELRVLAGEKAGRGMMSSGVEGMFGLIMRGLEGGTDLTEEDEEE